MPRMNDQDRETILRIKKALAERLQTKGTISSTLVYEAVMDHGVRTVDEFESWHQEHAG